MAIDRRALLLGLGASGALSLTAFADTRGEAAFVACTREADGNYAAVVLDADANVLFSEGLDARGHDAAIAPDGRTAVVFARRPGRFAIVLDLVARLLVRGYLTLPAGADARTLQLAPALTVDEALLDGFVVALAEELT